MAEQLTHYLTGKEIEACRRLQGAIHAFPGIPPQLSSVGNDGFRLNHTVDDVVKRIDRLSTLPNGNFSLKDWNLAISEINSALWGDVEIIEGSVVELFQQIDQIGFEQWTVNCRKQRHRLRSDLSHRLDDIILGDWGAS